MNARLSPAAAECRTPDAGQRSAMAALYGVSALAGTAIGLFGTLIATLLTEAGWTEVAVGRNAGVFFLCVMLAAPLASGLVQRRGARLTVSAGLGLAAAGAVCFPLLQGAAAWTLLRAVMGLGVGLYMIAGQTLLNRLADDHRRGSANGLHALAFGVGVGLGPLLGAGLYRLSPVLAFSAGALALLLGQALVWRLPVLAPGASAPPDFSLWRRLSLPLHAVFAYGAAEATLMSLFPVFMLGRGHDVTAMSAAFAAFVAGSLASVLPLTRAADRFGARPVLAGCSLLGLAASLGLVWLPPQAQALSIGIVACLAGAAVGPIFPLALVLMSQQVPHERLPGGAALFTVAFGLGSLCAPWLASLSMRTWGAAHLFSFTAVLLASLLVRLLRAGRRVPQPPHAEAA